MPRLTTHAAGVLAALLLAPAALSRRDQDQQTAAPLK
jgi:hypothetical protein